MTEITTYAADGLRESDIIMLSDDRPWWRRVWHWIIRHDHEKTRTLIVRHVQGYKINVEKP